MGRLIDADALMPKLRLIREAEHQIYGKESWGFASKCITAIEDAPTVPQWISVTERMPEDEYVLISKKPTKISGDKWSVAIAIRTADPRSGKIQWRDSGFGVIQDDKVLAWMPLPEPYKKVDA